MKKTKILFPIGLMFFGLSALIGSEIGADGTLIEKGFVLIPIGYCFIFAGTLTFAYQQIRKRIN